MSLTSVSPVPNQCEGQRFCKQNYNDIYVSNCVHEMIDRKIER